MKGVVKTIRNRNLKRLIQPPPLQLDMEQYIIKFIGSSIETRFQIKISS